MKKTQDTKNNSFRVRIYDDEVLTQLYELASLHLYGSMNELMNEALKQGLEKMYLTAGKQKKFAEQENGAPFNRYDEMLKRQKSTEHTVDDVFVMMSVIEMLVTTLYNNEAMKLKGEEVSIELMESGFMAQLPENIQQVKDAITKRLSRKEKK